MAVYPAGIPDLSQLAPLGGVYAPLLEDFNLPRRELAAVIASLGLNPQGAEATVAARLATIAATTGAPGPAGAQGPTGPTGPAGSSGGSWIYDTDISANVGQGTGWSKFHTCPPVTAASAILLDYEWWMAGDTGRPNKPFQVLITEDDTAPSNNRANGIICGVQPNSNTDDHFHCRLLTSYSGSGSKQLRLWGRWMDYDPTVASYNASGGISFTVLKSLTNNFGAFRGVLSGN